jgi:ribonuclease VapC
VIVVDTSAIIAMLIREPGYEELNARMTAQDERFVPATAVLEATMVLTRFYGNPKPVIDQYLGVVGLEILTIDAMVVVAAQEAFLRFGKGRHPARLNLCDCFSYASAKVRGCPLLYVGNDFAETDIVAA